MTPHDDPLSVPAPPAQERPLLRAPHHRAMQNEDWVVVLRTVACNHDDTLPISVTAASNTNAVPSLDPLNRHERRAEAARRRKGR